jgi:sterol desaturase/sphingolipid hydroxylase (fatty acid hydroxylase superfamily)
LAESAAFDIVAAAHAVLEAVKAPAMMFFAPDSMFYWPYLVSTLAIACGVLLWHAPASSRSLTKALDKIFSRRVWFARSTKADLRYGLVNAFVFPLVIAPLGISGLAVGFMVADGLRATIGVPSEAVLNVALLTFLYTIIVFVCLELGHYIAHYMMHRIPVLWAFHRIHHSAQVLTPLTNLRHHPFDLLLLGSLENLFAGAATGVFLYLGDGSVANYTALGVHVGIVASRLYGNLQHSHIWLSFGIFDRVIMSPALHQIHHSASPEHRDHNYGLALSLWDWVFGTLYAPNHRPRFAMGLGDGQDGRLHSVAKMYFEPFAYLARAWPRRASPPTRATSD